MRITAAPRTLMAGLFVALLTAPAAAQPTQPDPTPTPSPSPNNNKSTLSADIATIEQISKEWREGDAGKRSTSENRNRLRTYNQLYRKLYAERNRHLEAFKSARDEKGRREAMKDAYEIADVLNKAQKPDLMQRDGSTRIAPSRFKNYDPAGDVDRGLGGLNEDLARTLREAEKLINSNKEKETRAALDQVRSRLKALEDLDRTQALVEAYLFGNGMFIGDTRWYTQSFKEKRERLKRLMDLYDDFEKAFERKWPSEKSGEDREEVPDENPGAADENAQSADGGTPVATDPAASFPEQAQNFAWLLGTWNSYSPWGDQTEPTGGTLVFTIASDGTVEGRIGALNDYQKDVGYLPGMLVYRGFRDVRSYGPTGTTRFESFDGEFLQIQGEVREWRSESIGVRQNGILYQSPPAYSTLAGPFRKKEITM